MDHLTIIVLVFGIIIIVLMAKLYRVPINILKNLTALHATNEIISDKLTALNNTIIDSNKSILEVKKNILSCLEKKSNIDKTMTTV